MSSLSIIFSQSSIKTTSLQIVSNLLGVSGIEMFYKTRRGREFRILSDKQYFTLEISDIFLFFSVLNQFRVIDISINSSYCKLDKEDLVYF